MRGAAEAAGGAPPRWRRAVLLGGSGFCGAHLAEALIDGGRADTVLLVDLQAPRRGAYTPRFDALCDAGRITYVPGDVRRRLEIPAGPVDLLVNLAAVHREPGHAPEEYFATNVAGAQHGCALADAMGCHTQLFVSSIAVYGAHDGDKSEATPPRPTSPYGASKLEAEAIHRAWAAADAGRVLAIVRPGVVYGPGEGGNVTRLVHAVLRRRFAYVGSPRVPKAGIYVKEFARAALFAVDAALAERGREPRQAVTVNLTASPAPTVAEYVAAICGAAGVRRWVPTLPVWAVLPPVMLAYGVARLLGQTPPWHPTRVRKLARPNAIAADELRRRGYVARFGVREAMDEWRAIRPDEWTP